jgi:thiol-disulfide isomerase/thioredoxin
MKFRVLPALIVLSFLSGHTAIAADAAKHPMLNVKTIDGKTFDLAQEKNHWVIVNFWATWCSPCLKEIPDISAFVAAHKNVSAIGLDFEEIEADDLKSFLKQHPVGYAVAVVDVYNPPKDFEVPRGLPTTYVIAPDGSIAKRFTGPITGSDLEKVLKDAGASGT